MQNVFHNADDIAIIGSDWIDRLKGIALTSPLKRARICLHRSDEDGVHEMIIALARDCLFPPHRHVAKNELFHMIEGRLGVVIFNDDGSTRRSFVLLGDPDNRGRSPIASASRLFTPWFLWMTSLSITRQQTAHLCLAKRSSRGGLPPIL